MGAQVYITSDDNGPNGAPDGAPPADAGQKTLDFLSAIKNAPPANDNKGAPASPVAAKPADPGAATLQFLQAAKAGALPEPKKPYETTGLSVAKNAAAGFNEAVADTLGAPVDAANYVMRHPLEIAQKLTPAGQIQPFLDLVGGPKIVPDLHTPELPGANVAPIGGSESIKQGMGLIGANPDTLAPQNSAERIARGLGGGVASAMAPEAAVGGLTRLGAAVPKFVQAAIGSAATPGAVASNAAIGGVAGATGETAAEFTPDDIAGAKPFIRAVGNLAGGGVAAVAKEAPALARAGVKAAQDFAAPMNPEGQQRLADEILANGTQDRQASLQKLQDNATTGVGGVPLTTYQVTEDHGIGAMDRAAETQEGGVGPSNARRAAQNEARVGVIKALQPTGDPAAVAGHIRDHLADIDEMTAGIQRQATVGAQGKAAAIGHGTPEGHGAVMRGALADSQAAAKAHERALWQAVDPDGKLAMGSAPISTAARRIETTIPQAAKGMEGEEAGIFKAAKDLDQVSKFSEITALRSRISDEMRAQRGPNGNPTVLARLTQLRGVVERAIENAAEHKAGQEAEAVKSGAMKPEETMAAALQAKADEFRRARAGVGAQASVGTAGAIGTPAVSPTVRARGESGGQSGIPSRDQSVPGSSRTIAAPSQEIGSPSIGDSVFTPSGRQVGVTYKVVDAGDLTASNNADMTQNPRFPQQFQPRDRTRAASETQVAKIAGNLQPERLGASTSVTEGAPIIGPDGVVESGNGRVLGIRRAYQQGGDAAQRYRNYLTQQGFNTAGMKEPVLVRQRTTALNPDERVRFTQEANASSGLTLSPSERAAIDSKRVPDSSLDLYRGGEINSAANRDFVKSWMKNVPDHGEEGQLATSAGALSIEGAQRIRNSLLHAAYGDSNLVSALAETGDENIRAFGNVLSDTSGRMAQLRREIAAGDVSQAADLSTPLLEAARVVQRARMNGDKLHDLMAQQDAFNPISDTARQILQIAYGPKFTGRLSRDTMAKVLDSAASEARLQTTEDRLFGEPIGAPNILKTIGEKYGKSSSSEEAGAQQFSFGASAARPSNGAGGASGERPAIGPERVQGAGESALAPRQEASRPLAPALTANLDENAAARIKAASEATKERAQTFKQGAVGETLAEQGAKGNYRILDSAVGPKFFKPGVSGAEAVNSFKTAVGNDAEAMQALENFAGLSLRKAAMNADGTLDPAKFASWQKAHSDALRAMPDVAAKFSDAAKASETVADATAMRAAALDGYQKTALGKFLKLSDAGDVTRTVGEIFGRKSAIQDMRALASEVSNNPDAREGLRKAVADFMTGKFVGNTEQMKSDVFQTFVRENKPVLAQVFSHDEIKGVEAVAAELSRVKRLADLQALPGRSTTAQDLIKPIKEAGEAHGLSPFAETMVGAVEGFHAMGVPGAIGGAAAAAAKQKVMGARAAGMQNVQKLVRGMLLNPELARAALERAPTVKPITRDIRFTQQLNRVAAIAAQRQISQKQDARR